MTREEKGAIIDELSQKFQSIPYFYITDASGMSVAETNDLRRKCFENGIEYVVVKNTLIRKALETVTNTDYTPFDNEVLTGFSGVMFHPDNGKAAAKLIKEFRKTNDKLKLKGASVDYSLFVGADQLDTLINLKSRTELIGEIVGLLQSPAKNVVSALQSGGGKLAGILKTLSEREAEAA